MFLWVGREFWCLRHVWAPTGVCRYQLQSSLDLINLLLISLSSCLISSGFMDVFCCKLCHQICDVFSFMSWQIVVKYDHFYGSKMSMYYTHQFTNLFKVPQATRTCLRCSDDLDDKVLTIVDTVSNIYDHLHSFFLRRNNIKLIYILHSDRY